MCVFLCVFLVFLLMVSDFSFALGVCMATGPSQGWGMIKKQVVVAVVAHLPSLFGVSRKIAIICKYCVCFFLVCFVVWFFFGFSIFTRPWVYGHRAVSRLEMFRKRCGGD